MQYACVLCTHVYSLHYKDTITKLKSIIEIQMKSLFYANYGKKEIRVARAAENAITFWKCSACRDGKLCMIVVVVRRKGSRASTRLQYKGGIHKSSIAESERGIYYITHPHTHISRFSKMAANNLNEHDNAFFIHLLPKLLILGGS